MSNVTKTAVNAAKWMSTAGVIAAAVAFTPTWEGMDKVAKKDMIGTGHPVTYCYGQTDEFGKVKVGTKFTKAECDQKLAESLPKYLMQLDKYIKVPLPTDTVAALLDASYNAGPAAVGKSPMLVKMNAGDLKGGCEAFRGWYTRSDGVVRKGLVFRRSGGDSRKSERDLCLENLNQPRDEWYTGYAAKPETTLALAKNAPVEKEAPAVCERGWVDDQTYTSHPAECRKSAMVEKPKTVVHKRHLLKPKAVTCTGFLFWQECK